MIKKLFWFVSLSLFVFAGCSTSKTDTSDDNVLMSKKPRTVRIIRPNHKTQEALTKDIKKIYTAWKAKYFRTVPGSSPTQKYLDYGVEYRENKSGEIAAPYGSGWIKYNALTVSEAHGYGMIVMAAMANMDPSFDPSVKEDFDAMYRFFRAHPSVYSPDLMCWLMVGEGLTFDKAQNKTVGTVTGVKNTSKGPDSAIDGDMDIAYALLMADNIWGSDGEINYRAEALKVIKAIMTHVVNKEENILLMGDWVKAKLTHPDPKERATSQKMLTATRSSDFMLSHLRVFANVDKENRDKWLAVLANTENIIRHNVKEWSQDTGLVADFLVKDKAGNYAPSKGYLLEGNEDGDYNWNASRNPWRFPIDYIYSGHDGILNEIQTLNRWVRTKVNDDPKKIKPGYYIRGGKTGEPIAGRTWEDTAFITPFTVNACVGEENQQWLNTLWDYTARIPVADQVYFGNTIRMQLMFIVAGEWFMPK